MSVIKVLDRLLSNQIAAGEVIDRPASVVKELVENAIDASATRIDIEITKGGMESIQVRDNGCGMVKADLSLSLLRHATSKVASYQDLIQIRSLGFRGEALASMASVSKMILSSCHRDSDQAWQLVSKADCLDEPKPVAHPKGTTVEVKDLFFNTPARRKFMRTQKTEFLHIETVIKRIALVYPAIQFSLTHNQQLKWRLPIVQDKRSQELRLSEILGHPFVQKSIEIEYEAAGLKLTGWLALPIYHRAQMDQQYFYVNGRYVKDKLLTSAMRQAYQGVIFHGRYPAYVLALSIEAAEVDVNVHPTKHEVRFRDARTVFQLITHSVKQALAEVRLDTSIFSDQEQKETAFLAFSEEKTSVFAGQLQPSFDLLHKTSLQPLFESSPTPSLCSREAFAPQKNVYTEPRRALTLEKSSALPAQQILEPVRLPVLGAPLAQLHNIYILAQQADGLMIVDMHAAHERILFEKLKKQWDQKSFPAQRLLIPVEVYLTEGEMDCLEARLPYLEELGFQIDRIAENSLLIRQIPLLLQKANLPELICDMAQDLNVSEYSGRAEQVIDRLLANMACKTAVKAGHSMTQKEMQDIFEEMECIPHGGLCNHGRPSYHLLSLKEIDRWFLRGQ